MNKHKLSLCLFLAGSLSLSLGCEREAVGETYAGQVHGGSSVELSNDSPPRGATEAAGVPAEQPEYDMHGNVPPGDPSIYALLGTSGQVMRDNAPEVRYARPTPPQPETAQVEGATPEGAGTATIVATPMPGDGSPHVEINNNIAPEHRAVIVNSPPPAH